MDKVKNKANKGNINGVRISSGVFRGKKLLIPPADITRPSSDRTKEAVFSILDSILMSRGQNWQQVCFLDCFAGSGAFGIEALSKGANIVVMVENNRIAMSVIKKNLAELPPEYKNKYQLYSDVFSLPLAQETSPLFSKDKRKKQGFDFIFMDAPYGKDLSVKALVYLQKQYWLTCDSIIIIETEKDEDLPLPPSFALAKVKYYGKARINLLSFGDA